MVRTPSNNRGRSYTRKYRTPPTPGSTVVKKKRPNGLSSSRSVSSVVNTLANLAAISSPSAAKIVRGVRAARSLTTSARKLFTGRGQQTSVVRRSTGVGFYKSGGKFKGKISNRTQMDRCADNGFVQKLEYTNTLNTNRQVAYVAHSTMPAQLVARVVFKAMLKKLFNLAGYNLRSEDQIILRDSQRSGYIRLFYKFRDGDAENFLELIVLSDFLGSTIETLVDTLILDLNSLITTNPNQAFQMLRIVYYIDYRYLPTDLPKFETKSEMDLLASTLTVFSKSRLKIQNRTVNSAGNNEADDVDNVPLYGKMFEYRTNSSIYRDYYKPTGATTSRLTTSPLTGCLPAPSSEEPAFEKWYVEVPLSSQIIGCYSTQSAKIEPGQIKTSVMYDKVTMSFNNFFQKVIRVGDLQRGDGRFSQYWIGKTKLIGLEKMVNAVATADNEIRLASEHQIDLGCMFNVRKIKHTAPSIKIKLNDPSNAAWV